jgi:hypothetical protein
VEKYSSHSTYPEEQSVLANGTNPVIQSLTENDQSVLSSPSAPGPRTDARSHAPQGRIAAPACGLLGTKPGGSITLKSSGPIWRKTDGSNHSKSCIWQTTLSGSADSFFRLSVNLLRSGFCIQNRAWKLFGGPRFNIMPTLSSHRVRAAQPHSLLRSNMRCRRLPIVCAFTGISAANRGEKPDL